MGIQILSVKRNISSNSKFVINKITRKRGNIIIKKKLDHGVTSPDGNSLKTHSTNSKSKDLDLKGLRSVLKVLAAERVHLTDELSKIQAQNQVLKERIASLINNEGEMGLGYQSSAL